MEFSMTEQQVPMFIRLMFLLYALQQKQLKPYSAEPASSAISMENKGIFINCIKKILKDV